MIKPLQNNSYHNKAGRWDIEVDYEDSPRDVDAKSEVYYYKILGPKKELFSYKLVFPLAAIKADPERLGEAESRDIRVELALYKARDLIKSKKHKDMVIDFVKKEKWRQRNTLEELIHHSEG